jgi:hypothetical protein
MINNVETSKRWICAIILMLTSTVGYASDTGWSNVQEGVRMKIIGFGQDVPLLRIENNGGFTLAIRNDIYLGRVCKIIHLESSSTRIARRTKPK